MSGQQNLDRLAKILSLLTSPNLLDLPLALVFATVLPFAILFLLARRRVIQDVEVSDRRDRIFPFVGVLASYLIGTFALASVNAALIVTSLMLCHFGNTLIMMLISFRWKISIHASGITGPFTALVFHFGPLLSPLLLLVIPVGWSRLHLKAHNWLQILAGALVTIPLTWLQLAAYLALL